MKTMWLLDVILSISVYVPWFTLPHVPQNNNLRRIWRSSDWQRQSCHNIMLRPRVRVLCNSTTSSCFTNCWLYPSWRECPICPKENLCRQRDSMLNMLPQSIKVTMCKKMVIDKLYTYPFSGLFADWYLQNLSITIQNKTIIDLSWYATWAK